MAPRLQLAPANAPYRIDIAEKLAMIDQFQKMQASARAAEFSGRPAGCRDARSNSRATEGRPPGRSRREQAQQQQPRDAHAPAEHLAGIFAHRLDRGADRRAAASTGLSTTIGKDTTARTSVATANSAPARLPRTISIQPSRGREQPPEEVSKPQRRIAPKVAS